jgi:hypothetical protein
MVHLSFQAGAITEPANETVVWVAAASAEITPFRTRHKIIVMA